MGRLAELVKYINGRTGDGRMSAEVVIEIATNPNNRAADRLRAVEMLWDRTLGKPVDIQATLHVANAQAGATGGLAADILESLIRALPVGDTAAVSGDVVDVTPEPEPTGDIPASDPEKSSS
jgi:hypothetical protein